MHTGMRLDMRELVACSSSSGIVPPILMLSLIELAGHSVSS